MLTEAINNINNRSKSNKHIHKNNICIFIFCLFFIFSSFTITSENTSQPVIKWKRVPGANGYLVEITDKTGKFIYNNRTKDNELQLSLPEGNYQIRITTINKFDKLESGADWQYFTVSKISTPVINSVSPNSFFITNSRSEMFVSGSNFDPNAKITLSSDNRSITINNFTYNSKDSVSFFFNPAALGMGTYSISITNPGTESARLDNNIVILENDTQTPANPTYVTHETNIALINAVKNGDLAKFNEMTANGADPLSYDENGYSTLHYAAAGGHLSIIRTIEELGGDMEIRDPRGATPLHHASFAGQSGVVRYLVEISQVDINAVTTIGYAPIDRAAIKSKSTIVNYLITKGARINYQVSSKETPLHFACYAGDNLSVKYLLEADNTLLEIKEKRGYTCLHYAAWYGHEDVARTLLTYNANKYSLSNSNDTPLDMAKIAQKNALISILSDNTR